MACVPSCGHGTDTQVDPSSVGDPLPKNRHMNRRFGSSFVLVTYSIANPPSRGSIWKETNITVPLSAPKAPISDSVRKQSDGNAMESSSHDVDAQGTLDLELGSSKE